MSSSDLAVISFGMTAYEIAALNIPALYICISSDHALSSNAFVNAGFGISLGLYDNLNDSLVQTELKNYERAINSYKEVQKIYPSMQAPKVMIPHLKELIKGQSI